MLDMMRFFCKSISWWKLFPKVSHHLPIWKNGTRLFVAYFLGPFIARSLISLQSCFLVPATVTKRSRKFYGFRRTSCKTSHDFVFGQLWAIAVTNFRVAISSILNILSPVTWPWILLMISGIVASTGRSRG